MKRDIHGQRVDGTLITSAHLTTRRPELDGMTLDQYREHCAPTREEKRSVLGWLDDRSVVSFGLSHDKRRLNVIECCDYYYNEEMTRLEAQQLIRELTALVEQMD